MTWPTVCPGTWQPWWRDNSEEPKNEQEDIVSGRCSQWGRIHLPQFHQRLRALPQLISWFLIVCCTAQIKFSFYSTSKMWLLSAHFAWDYFHPLPSGMRENWGVDWWNGLYSAAQQISVAADSELLMLDCDFMIINTESVPHSYGFNWA